MIAFRIDAPSRTVGQHELRLMTAAVAASHQRMGSAGLDAELLASLRAAGIVIVPAPFRSDAA